MKKTTLIIFLVGSFCIGGCAVIKSLGKSFNIGGGQPRFGPVEDLKNKRKAMLKGRKNYYQDKNGLRPNLSNSIGKAVPKLFQLLRIDQEPVGIAPDILEPNCNNRKDYIREWTRDKKGAEAFFKAYPAMAREAIRLKARDDAYWVGLNFQKGGGFKRIRLLEGTPEKRIKEYNLASGIEKIKIKLKRASKCPHAPAEIFPPLEQYVDTQYKKYIAVLHKFFDHLLFKQLKGRKILKNARYIPSGTRRRLSRIARRFLSKYKIKTIRFVDRWHKVNQIVRKVVNRKIVVYRIHEDYTRMNVYVDYGPQSPFLKCFALDGIKDYMRGKALRVSFARRYGYCESVPK